MKKGFLKLCARLFSSAEISGVGTVGTMRLLRGRGAKTLNYIGKIFAYTKTRSYGLFFLSFGLLSLLLHLGAYYLGSIDSISPLSAIISAALAVIALPLLASVKPVCILIQDIDVIDTVLFDFLGMKRMPKNATHTSIPPIVAMLLGIVPAALSYFLSVEWVFLGIVVLIVGSIALTTPEFSLMLSIVLLPYLRLMSDRPDVMLCVMSLLTFVSYAIKVVIGKRVFNFDAYSILAILCSALVLVSGLFGGGENSPAGSLIIISLIAIYFPISNIIVNKRLVDSVANAIIISAIPIAVISVIEFIVENPKTSFVTPLYSTEGVSAFFAEPSALAGFLLVSLLLTLYYIFERSSLLKKSVYGVFSLIEALALGVILHPAVWVTALFSVLAYAVIRSRRIPIDLILLLIGAAYLLFLVPNDAIDALFESLGVSPLFSERMPYYEDAFKTLAGDGWLGVGNGEVRSFNLLLGVAVRFGIPMLVLVLFAIILRLRHLSFYRHYVRNSLVSAAGDMTAVSTVSLILLGTFEDVFLDVSIFYLFIVIFALSSAILRTAKTENDDLLGYYGDQRSSDSSALDVNVNR